MKGLIVVPAYNEAPVIREVLDHIPKKIDNSLLDVVVVDDGSSDSTLDEISKSKREVLILSHIVNRGAGAATKTGLIWAKENDYDFAITYDADGQHNPDDLDKIIKPLEQKESEVVIGSRLKSKQRMPFDRVILNKLANLLTYLLYGYLSSDSQSGLRGFSNYALNTIDFKGERYDFSSEIFLEARRNKLSIIEVPSSVIYTSYSRSKGQKSTNMFSMVKLLILKLIK